MARNLEAELLLNTLFLNNLHLNIWPGEAVVLFGNILVIQPVDAFGIGTVVSRVVVVEPVKVTSVTCIVPPGSTENK